MTDLIPLYREMAAGGDQFHGLSILQHSKLIGKLIRKLDVRTLLDYGCGRGDAYGSPHKLWHEWGLKRPAVVLYDPAFPEHDKLPDRMFDMVVCSDVLEHVAEEYVDKVIDDLFMHAGKIVWASVCCREAKKTFPQTGENLHVTVRPFEWWEAKFQERRAHPLKAPVYGFHLVETP